ncbi:hypothetical protein I204_03388 [Kwoniella mangroviensis CBS 8886]|uniref:uncharacterized protein n=1 Tax=Kwoniella mangroviensis CBS 8507 TaxID=1296122 RepID=UPI00080CDE62|nr:uncharacterized protein I203_00448 [Kwoniella mangroviensis CBS 8507]OCF70315.1 hypothetical protein I203_00448 [Kwoniella mangroviensis CBS 8507]OCF76090.1 hypothetical protein I204_03388 [Kwoniella mangroviensis CBS 8886]
MSAKDYYGNQQQQYGQPQYGGGYPQQGGYGGPQGGYGQQQGGYYPPPPQQSYQQPGLYSNIDSNPITLVLATLNLNPNRYTFNNKDLKNQVEQVQDVVHVSLVLSAVAAPKKCVVTCYSNLPSPFLLSHNQPITNIIEFHFNSHINLSICRRI